MALMYCKKCGRLVQGHYDDNDESPFYCDCCDSITYKVPKEFLISEDVPIIKSELEEQFIEQYIKSSPEFNQQAYENKDRILAEMDRRYNRFMEWEKNRVSCSYCGSTNVSKIGFFSRLGSAELWGLGSDKIGKQFHCNNCGANF